MENFHLTQHSNLLLTFSPSWAQYMSTGTLVRIKLIFIVSVSDFIFSGDVG